MSARKLRCVVITLVLSVSALLLPAAPAHAGLDSARGLNRNVLQQVGERSLLETLAFLISKIFTHSGGGMDPNGIG